MKRDPDIRSGLIGQDSAELPGDDALETGAFDGGEENGSPDVDTIETLLAHSGTTGGEQGVDETSDDSSDVSASDDTTEENE